MQKRHIALRRVYSWSRMISSRFEVEQGGCARNSSIRATVADPASLSPDMRVLYRVMSCHGSSPTHENASRLFSPSYSFASDLLSPHPLVASSSISPVGWNKVSSRFNPKDSSHGKYLLIATFRSAVLVFPMRGGIRGYLLSWFFVAAEQTFALRYSELPPECVPPNIRAHYPLDISLFACGGMSYRFLRVALLGE